MTERNDHFADDMAEYLPTFLDETEEQLDELVETLLVLESDLHDREALNESFRLIHSIKGSAGIMGFENITVLTHHLENRFEQFRSGLARLDESTMNLVLRCIDFLRECTGRLRNGQPLGSSSELLAEVKDLERQPEPVGTEHLQSGNVDPLVSEAATAPTASLESTSSLELGDSLTRLIVHFRSGLQLIDLKAQLIVNRLSALGTVRFTRPELDQLADIENLDAFEIHIETTREQSELCAVSEVDGVESIECHAHSTEMAGLPDPFHAEEGTSQTLTTDAQGSAAETTDTATTMIASSIVDENSQQCSAKEGPVSPEQELKTAPKSSPEITVEKTSETMRVEIDRLDNLMNLAGELVVNRARFEQISAEVSPELRKANLVNKIREFSDNLRMTITGMEDARNGNTDWSTQIRQLRSGLELMEEQSEVLNQSREYVNQMGEAIDHLSRVSHGLRRGVLGTRMVPVAPLFNRFKRVVRDLSNERGKRVNLVIQGEKTELDKRMIDELGDPLVHLVRNSIDHGLETREQRVQIGKPESGTIKLEASHRGNNIYILVQDDGRGINVDMIKSKLIEKGLLSESEAAELTREQALEYIWHAGFSTAEKVTDVSGRGVGMDVVKQRLDSLNGTMQIDSTPGQGTTFTIRLPLTLAIITSLLVRVRNTTFSLPIDDVREIVSIDQRDVVTVLGNQTFDVRGEFIPLRSVDDIFYWHGINFGRNGNKPMQRNIATEDKMKIVVLSSAGKTIGLRVDELLGSQDLVIKSLSDNFIAIRGLSGASILGDGNVCLMLEVGTVIDMAVSSPQSTPTEDPIH